MSLTVTTIKKNVVGNQYERILEITFDSSYPTGGESFTVNDCDKTFPTSAAFHYVGGFHQNNGTAAINRLVTYDYANKKLFVATALGTEASNASDQSALIVRCIVRYGTGAV